MRLPLFSFLLVLAWLAGQPALADDAADRARLATDLLQRAGTARVLDMPAVQAALADPVPHLAAPPERLLSRAGLQPWTPPRVWLLRQVGENWVNLAEEPSVAAAAQARGLPLATARVLPSSALLFPAFLRQEEKAMQGLLGAHDADALVLVGAGEWTVLRPGLFRQFRGQPALAALPAAVAEVLAQSAHWPEAGNRALLEVSGIADLKALLTVQSLLQSLAGPRQVQLVRTEGETAWFAFVAPVGDSLRRMLDSEPRLPVRVEADAGLPGVMAARRLAGVQPPRRFASELAVPPAPAAP
ncbi:MAG: hypothetical protein ACK4UT_03355 [Moraxellaceae bacterium]